MGDVDKSFTETAATTSALPMFYYIAFAVYEPLLTTLGFLSTLKDPKPFHDGQAPWPNNRPPTDLPLASRVTTLQLAHVCALLGAINFFVLPTARKHLAPHPELQEKVVSALLTPLLFGDVLHIGITFWGLGDQKWDVAGWTPLFWATILTGLTLFVPRVMWHLGIWRYVHSRDGKTKSS